MVKTKNSSGLTLLMVGIGIAGLGSILWQQGFVKAQDTVSLASAAQSTGTWMIPSDPGLTVHRVVGASTSLKFLTWGAAGVGLLQTDTAGVVQSIVPLGVLNGVHFDHMCAGQDGRIAVVFRKTQVIQYSEAGAIIKTTAAPPGIVGCTYVATNLFLATANEFINVESGVTYPHPGIAYSSTRPGISTVRNQDRGLGSWRCQAPCSKCRNPELANDSTCRT